MKTCPNCKSDNGSGAMRCANCGEILVHTVRLNTYLPSGETGPRIGTRQFDRAMRLVLYFTTSQQSIELNMHEVGTVLLGRHDPKEASALPKVDLTFYGGVEKGVSRQHARIDMDDSGTLYIQDLGAVNGTFVNRKRLVMGQTRVLRDGDEVVLGRLRLHTLYKEIATFV